MNKFFSYFWRFDWLLLAACLILLVFSLVVLYSLDIAVGKTGLSFFDRQLIASLLGLVLLFLLAGKNYKSLQNYGWLALIVSFLLLISVLLFGQEIRNIKAWFVIGPFTWQPIEFVKILYIIFLARYFSQVSHGFYTSRHLFVSGTLTALLMLLVILQPDWGSALVLFFIWLVIIFLVPFRRWHYVIVVVLLVITTIVSWQWVLAPYQKSRVTTLINPYADPLDAGYNLTQAKVAVGSGGLWGRGLGLGTQSQLRFLPEAQTDFIFAVIAEELGLLGSMFLLLLFVILFWRLFKITKLARTDFGMIMVFGIIIYLFIHFSINIGMNIGLLPIAGVPLPLVSAAGSSVLATLIGLGLVESVYLHDK